MYVEDSLDEIQEFRMRFPEVWCEKTWITKRKGAEEARGSHKGRKTN